MELRMASKTFNKAFLVLSLFIFAVVAVRAALVPFCHDETATFFYYIQTGDFLPYVAHGDANNHILNSFLGWICFRLFSSSPLALRLPNLISLLILIIAVYRLAGQLTHNASKVILVAGLMISFNWLGFYDVCRGYGMSMALLALAFSYIPDYIEYKRFPDLLKIYVLLNLALCANLTLILAILIITFFICLFQLYHRRFFTTGNMVLLCVHAAIFLCWVKYSFFLQQNNLLYAGQGTSYWQVSFVSLIYTIVGKQNFFINTSVLVAYGMLMITCLYFFLKKTRDLQSGQYWYTFFLVITFNGLIVAFYLLKKMAGINFPEDRTGLFFYPLFILNAAFIIDMAPSRISNVIAGTVFTLFIVNFIMNINFRKHTLDMYAIVPERFYNRLEQEQNQNSEKITVGGNRFRELFYAFMNYRNQGKLNLMDIPEDPEDMDMNDDYYIAYKVNRNQYLPYYQEIDSDKDYGFTLLKRRQFLIREPAFSFPPKSIVVDENSEFFNLLEVRDTAIKDRSPLLVEFKFKIPEGDMPSRAWIVLDIDSAEGQAAYYKRIPLNWIRYNWPNMDKSSDLTIETGPLPAKIHRLVCYLWNDKKQRLKIAMDTIRVFHVEGKGSNVVAHVNADF